jgi:hypothetical protein
MHHVGNFEVMSGALMASDPCYVPGTWCARRIENVLNGTWRAEIMKSYSYDGPNRGRVHALEVVHKDFNGVYLGAGQEITADLGVDSGQMSFVDAHEYVKGHAAHPSGGEYDEELTFYGDACKKSLSDFSAGILMFNIGVVSRSGWGDGGYPLEIWRNGDGKVVKCKVTFIDDEDNDEDE